MANLKYKKYKISLQDDSNSINGLRVGDIVRRQYMDQVQSINTLMCVLESTDKYFIGALLEGDRPHTGQLLNFVRVTSLCDPDRSGALYLTANDSNSPYMDVIDNIGEDKGICWPIQAVLNRSSDTKRQYLINAANDIELEYLDGLEGMHRVCRMTRKSLFDPDISLKQTFTEFVANPNRILVSYRIKANKDINYKVAIGYDEGGAIDGESEETATTDWQYKFFVVSVVNNGRHKRAFSIDLNNMAIDDEIVIADLAIILQSNVSDYGTSSKIRIGKLDGVVDTVFGDISGYGAHIQQLYASNGAHISGTLTAGDENGFGATFYAGKLHRNKMLDSLNFSNNPSVKSGIKSPTSVGSVIQSDNCSILIQTKDWLNAHLNETYTLSFWYKANSATSLKMSWLGESFWTFSTTEQDVGSWRRRSVTFKMTKPDQYDADAIVGFTSGDTFQLSSFQLEEGKGVTQYQPTDSVVLDGDDYGAWFSRGGIGGTTQHPLLKLNYDGLGSIGASNGAFELCTNGSGQIAKNNITWNEKGEVSLSKNVKVAWDNITEGAKEEMLTKSVKIDGATAFSFYRDIDGNAIYDHEKLTLTAVLENIGSTELRWSYLSDNGYEPINNSGAILNIFPDGEYWQGKTSLMVKCETTVNERAYYATHVINKIETTGYRLEIISSNGTLFENTECKTTLTAELYFQGKKLSDKEADEQFAYEWCIYIDNRLDEAWFTSHDIDNTVRKISIDTALPKSARFICNCSSKS